MKGYFRDGLGISTGLVWYLMMSLRTLFLSFRHVSGFPDWVASLSVTKGLQEFQTSPLHNFSIHKENELVPKSGLFFPHCL